MRKNVLVLTYWSFQDALIQSYTLPYVKQIATIVKGKVYLVCLEQEHLKLSSKEQQEVKNHLIKYNIIPIFLNYKKFGFGMVLKMGGFILQLVWLCISKKINYIHTWCTPAGSLGYILHTVTNIPLVLDSYEPHAESMVENKTWTKSSTSFKIMSFFEKKQSKVATFYISAANGMRDYAQDRFKIKTNESNYFVKPACVDLNVFTLNSDYKNLKVEMGLEGKIVCIYAGKLGGIYLKEEVFEFIKCCEDFWGDTFRFLILTNTSDKEIEILANESGCSLSTIIKLFVPFSEVSKYMSIADFALTPVKPVSTKKYCTPIKDGEYWAMGLPIVITKDISDDSEIIHNSGWGYVLKELTAIEYRTAVNCIDTILKKYSKEELYNNIRPLAETNRNFNIAEKIYKEIYGKQ